MLRMRQNTGLADCEDDRVVIMVGRKPYDHDVKTIENLVDSLCAACLCIVQYAVTFVFVMEEKRASVLHRDNVL